MKFLLPPQNGAPILFYCPLPDNAVGSQPVSALAGLPAMPSPDHAQKTIFIVEDNEITREGIGSILRIAGYPVEMAAGGREALSKLQAGLRPCLILLDMMMSDIDGWTFLKYRHAYEEIANIPVVVVTSLGVASNDWAMALGTVGLLRKPFETEELLKEVRKWCPA